MISLKGHNEFTVKFSYLQKIAEMLHYKTKRGAFADFLPLNFNDKVRTALQLITPFNDEQEIIRQFVYDLCEDPAAETAGRQKTMDVTLWQRPQGVKKL
jgi:hypothetical protein